MSSTFLGFLGIVCLGFFAIFPLFDDRRVAFFGVGISAVAAAIFFFSAALLRY